MKNWKKAAAMAVTASLCITALAGCGGSSKTEEKTDSTEKKSASDNTLHYQIGVAIDSLNPQLANDGTSFSVLAQCMEGLYTKDKDGKKTEMKSDADHQFTKPMAVLVNGNSASASEIYAGAIQDYGIGKIVGTQTYGKGVVQQIFDLDDGTAVKLTIAEYFTPKGRNINGKGITPDTKIEYKQDENNPDADNQLDKAVEEVKAQMK